MNDAAINVLKSTIEKASNTSYSHGAVILKYSQTLMALIETNVGVKNTKIPLHLLDEKVLNDKNTGRNDFLGEVSCDLYKTLSLTMNWISNREENRGVFSKTAKMETESIDAANELFAVSGVGMNNEMVKVEDQDPQILEHDSIERHTSTGTLTRDQNDEDIEQVEISPAHDSETENEGSDEECSSEFEKATTSEDEVNFELVINKRRQTYSINSEKKQVLIKNYKCDVCEKDFERLLSYQNHRRTHLEESHPERRPFQCDTCGKRYTVKTTLQYHQKRHSENYEMKRPHECNTCGKSFASKRDLRRHEISHSQNAYSKREYVCDMCAKRFLTKEELRRHQRIHSNEGVKRPFKCDTCGKQFRTVSEYTDHQRLHSQDDEVKRPFKCDTCGNRYSHSSVLKTHKKTHLEKDQLPHKCEDCGKRFVDKDHLRRHRNSIHLEINKLKQCTTCGKKFSSIFNLKNHTKTHSENDQTSRPHECNICGNRYQNKRDIIKHNQKHFQNDDVDRPHKCDTCGKRFSDNADLRRHHLRLHTQNDQTKRPYKCDVCEKSFTTSGNRNIHKRTHSLNDDVRRPYKCDICGLRFTQSGYLGQHKKTHVKNATEPSISESNDSINSSMTDSKKMDMFVDEVDRTDDRGAWSSEVESDESEVEEIARIDEDVRD